MDENSTMVFIADSQWRALRKAIEVALPKLCPDDRKALLSFEREFGEQRAWQNKVKGVE